MKTVVNDEQPNLKARMLKCSKYLKCSQNGCIGFPASFIHNSCKIYILEIYKDFRIVKLE